MIQGRQGNTMSQSTLHKAIVVAALAAFGGFVVRRARNVGDTTPPMPAQVSAAEERDLYLTPGGRYTLVDIESNGRMVPSQKYRGFRARHDLQPALGDRLCPITRTKANDACEWTIGGKIYYFCCPPCIDEFVRLAKEQPERVLPPQAYIDTNPDTSRFQ